MNNTIVLKMIIVLSITSTTLFAQTITPTNELELLDSLELYLFPYNAPDEQRDTLGVEKKRGSEKTYYAMGRKHQPKYTEAINILKKIRAKENKKDLPRFRQIVKKHLELYEKEWMIYLSPTRRIVVDFYEAGHRFPPHLDRTIFSLETDSMFSTVKERFFYAYELLQDLKLKDNHKWSKVASYIEENGIEFHSFILNEIQNFDFKDEGKDKAFMSLLIALRSVNEPEVDSVLLKKLPLFSNHSTYFSNTLFIVSRYPSELGMKSLLDLLTKNEQGLLDTHLGLNSTTNFGKGASSKTARQDYLLSYLKYYKEHLIQFKKMTQNQDYLRWIDLALSK